LSPAEQSSFYHLEEGSEVFPLDMFMAMEREEGGALFADGLERYGFLRDPVSASNPEGLPVGLTAATTRDLQFTGIKMVGVNCAACHVSELHYETRKVRLDGAGGHADINAFYQGLGKATQATATDAGRLYKFVKRLRQRANNPIMESSEAASSAKIFKAAPEFAVVRPDTSFDRELQAELAKIIKLAASQPPVDFTKTLALKSRPERLDPSGQFEAQLRSLMTDEALVSRIPKSTSRNSAFERALALQEKAVALPPEPVRSTSMAILEDAYTTVRLLISRVQFLARIADRMDVHSTPAGFGRIDAFGGARNLLFDGQQNLNAPVSYPHLWNFEMVDWLHWDGNTTSVIERNIGQALGLGAVVRRDTYESTVSLTNLYQLEQLALKIKPPRWEDTFGPVDVAAATRGAGLFDTHCARCHGGDPNEPGRILALADIGTDRNRSVNFNEPARDGRPNDRVIAEFMAKVKEQAIRDAGLSPAQRRALEGKSVAQWRLTAGYAARPLTAIWASAPYLHNNSVPTLDDLLRLPADRPASFYVGSLEYDPVKVGFITGKPLPGEKAFDTKLAGNSNAGHPWGPRDGNPDVEKRMRADLLEFLKTR